MGGHASTSRGSSARRRRVVCEAILAALAGWLGATGTAGAFEFESKSDLKVRWDNTFKYSVAYRLRNPSGRITDGDPAAAGQPPFAVGGPESDDGDRNFKKGIVSNRIDWFSELDVTYRNTGLRLSGAAWYDDVYNHGNDNTSQATVSTYSVPAGQFTSATRNLMGRKAEMLDAFVYLKSDPSSETPFSVRAGKHTVLYGESLFFGSNGIANAQAPTDVIKLLQVPGSQFKEIIRPIPQVSTQVQLSSRMSLGGYYQFQWRPHRLPAAGSYLSNADFVGTGAELLLPGSPITMRNVGDLYAKNSGQGGLQFKFRPTGGDVEYGLYAAQYHEKAPQFVVDPVNGTYRALYPENVRTFGGSFSTVLGEANVAGEASIRTNAPLVSGSQVDVGLQSNGDSNPLFAVGRTGHLQLSMVTLMGKGPFWEGATLLGEVAWNRRLSITKNGAALDPNVTRDALALRFIFEPQYFQVFPGVDLSVPIGLGYNPYGRSSAVGAFNGGASKGGDFSVGVTADIQKRVKASINYVHYFGSANALLTSNSVDPARGLLMLTGAQSLRDRNFISFSIQTTF